MLSLFWALITATFGIAGLAESDAARANQREAPKYPQLFAPGDLKQAGRITLTPTFTPDGSTIYFTQANCARIWNCPQQLMRSDRTHNGWSAPHVVPQTAGERVDWPIISPDGRELLFSWATRRARHEGQGVYEDFDLYRLDLTDPTAKPKPIDDPDINRIRGGAIAKVRYVNNETAPSLTQDGDLYFWTERLDGVGLRDVYVAPSDGQGGFLAARPVAAPINSAGEDDGSWVHPSGRLMLLNYSNRGGEGSTDIFVSFKAQDGAAWSTPRNLGASINSKTADFAPRLTPDLKAIVFTSDRFARAGDEGVYQVWTMPVADVDELVKALSDAGLRASQESSD